MGRRLSLLLGAFPSRVQCEFVLKVRHFLQTVCRRRSTHILVKFEKKNCLWVRQLTFSFLLYDSKPNVRYGHYGLHCASVEEAYFNIPFCPSLCYEMLIRPEAKTALNMQPLTTPIVSFFYLDSLDVRCLCSGSMNTSLRLVSTC